MSARMSAVKGTSGRAAHVIGTTLVTRRRHQGTKKGAADNLPNVLVPKHVKRVHLLLKIKAANNAKDVTLCLRRKVRPSI
jgi:hypothetical protein